MKKQPYKAFRRSDLDRAKPKKRIFHTILKRPKKHYSETGLVEDRYSSTTIVRIIAGLLLVHVIGIGGALMHGNLVKKSAGPIVTTDMTPPPAAAPATAPATGPVNMTATLTPVTPTPTAAPAGGQVHITQPTAQATAAPAPQPAKPVYPANTVLTQHLVSTGDTWSSIATANNTTVDVLKAANPTIAATVNLPIGTYLDVPVASSSAAGQEVVAQQQQEAAEEAAKFHVVERGQFLGVIARKYNISLDKLYKMNGLSEKDARRIQPGMKLRIRE